ncbi:tetratricopeptide repeat protein [Mitsuaria sp. WAJ17]|uniref:tetratricopeptide repeat protein n=1 Tax=Mitsuaria sp. WAJ17 TaxID=2761452 RepID=UPI001602BE62|nr:tetratricopeptide repeat protein [Mitsuaria sp. WAJ17]MBB2487426.1 tetratricopeptide repeat protein [Mitsuaria sp. WAJ17]
MTWSLPTLPRLLAALALALPGAGQAAVLSDPVLQSFFAAGQALELERAAQARLGADANDLQGQMALALSGLEWGRPELLEPSLRQMQACVERQPDFAPCQFVLGSLLSVQAVRGGALKALSLNARIRQHLQRAFELDPRSYEIRSALAQYYLAVPLLAGGSPSKARSLEQDWRRANAEQARMLRIFIALGDEDWADAERELKALRTGSDLRLAFDARVAYGQLGRHFVKDHQWERARKLYEQLMRDQPRQATGAYLMARLAQDQGRFDEAIDWLQRCRKLDGAELLPLDQRLGNAYEGLGDKAQARAAYERYLGGSHRHQRNEQEVRRSLAALEGGAG